MKVSIIIPVYNAEKTIGRLLDSLYNQTYTDFETIIVNDCSTDNTAEVVGMYIEKLCIKILSLNKNGGVSNARNCGIKEAEGDYFLFVDSDDTVDPMYVEHMVNIKNHDFVICQSRRDDEEKRESKATREVTVDEFKKNCYELWKDFRITNVWGVRYSASVIKNNDLFFNTSMKWGEDTLFNIEYLMHCSSMLSLQYNDYVYYKNINSASRKYEKSRYHDALIVATSFSEFAQNSEQLWMIKYIYWDMSVRHCINHLYDKADKEWKKQVWVDMMCAVNSCFFRTCIQDVLKHGTLDMKIYALCMKFRCMGIYLKIAKVLKL